MATPGPLAYWDMYERMYTQDSVMCGLLIEMSEYVETKYVREFAETMQRAGRDVYWGSPKAKMKSLHTVLKSSRLEMTARPAYMFTLGYLGGADHIPTVTPHNLDLAPF